jgi:hypothetical protein
MKTFPRILKFFYYLTIVSAFCANMIVVSHTTALSVLGAGMALRGPDGSMMTATDGLYEERKAVFLIFGFGLACTVGSVVICVWVILAWESALCCMILTLMTCRIIWNNYQRIHKCFDYDENETVDFRDIMEGPAAIRGVPMRRAAVASAAASSSLSSSLFSRRKAPKSHLKKTSSMPVNTQDEDSDEYSDLEWQQGSQKLLDKNSTMKHRGRSASPPENEHYIQTI